MRTVKLGRKARKFNPNIPHMRSLRMGMVLSPPPPTAGWSKALALPSDLGVMLNDTLGCCTCAGIYHARQVWSANANPPVDTEPDTNVLQVYENACGYKRGDSSTDQGAVEQDVLTYWLNKGVPVGSSVDKLLAFVEEDPNHIDGVKWSICDCGVVYIGFQLPKSFLEALDSGNVPDVWDVVPGDTLTDEGHCVILMDYDDTGFILISWGKIYTMTWAFFKLAVDECYPLADYEWIRTIGTSPGNLTVAQLENAMQGLKE